MNNTTPNDIKDLLEAINVVNKQSNYSVWVPSLRKKIKFSEITTGQQKQMIRALVDNPVYNTNFILALYDILKNNCLDDINIDNLFISDKIAIAIQLRSLSVNQKITVQTENGDVTIDFSTIDFEQKFIHDDMLFTEHGWDYKTEIQFTARPPSILREITLEKELRTKLDSVEMKTYDDVRNVLGDAYIGELAKYSYTLTIKSTNIKLYEQNFKQIYDILEKLPVQLIKQIIIYLEDVQKFITQMCIFDGIDVKGEKAQAEITLDAAFFAGK